MVIPPNRSLKSPLHLTRKSKATRRGIPITRRRDKCAFSAQRLAAYRISAEKAPSAHRCTYPRFTSAYVRKYVSVRAEEGNSRKKQYPIRLSAKSCRRVGRKLSERT